MKLQRAVTICHVSNILVQFTILQKVQNYYDHICVLPNTVISNDITPNVSTECRHNVRSQTVYRQTFISESPVKKLTILMG